MNSEEQVLVINRQVFDEAGAFQGLTFEVDRYLRRLFAPGTPTFVSRPQAETDPGFKQIIPYVIISHGDTYLSYVRGKRAGEKRLVGHRSIGIGGHINPGDHLPLFNTDFREAYRSAVEREVAEEVSIEAGHTDRVVVLLNDDSTEVGRVHLGIVHLWTLDAPTVKRREQMINQLAFMSRSELLAVRDAMETWSQICLDNLETMTLRGRSP